MDNEQRIEAFKDFLSRKYLSKLYENKLKGNKRVTIDFDILMKFSPDLADDLIEFPEDTLTSGDIAIDRLADMHGFHLRVRGDIPKQKIRIRDLRSIHLNKMWTVEGTIETKTQVHSKMTVIRYECPSCGLLIPMLQMADEVAEPKRCGCGRVGGFKILSKELMDCFSIRLQELSAAIKYGSGLQSINILCNDDLTDSIIEEKLIEGQRIKVNGIYKERTVKKNGSKQTQLVTYIEANYIHLSEETYFDLELSHKDIEQIKEFSKTPDLIRHISQKLFEGVYGDDKIKEALVLQSFGGVSNFNVTPKLRGDMHILLVGDTGTNKSVYCEYIMKFSPKTVLAVGKTVSAVGLSGCPVKDELTGTWVLKPGAIALANNATMIIDEFDKMREEDKDILLEPMEQQTLTINKANLTERKMLARASFLVTMNPKNSFFNEFDLTVDQIDLPQTILNRFDLIYVKKKDRVKSEKNYIVEKEKAKIMMTRGKQEKQESLEEFQKFMRKYIAYAKQFVKPICSDYISEEYLPEIYARFDHDLKDKKDMYPISARHLFIIRRIAEARRRILLGSEVVKEDVDYALEMLRGSLQDIVTNKETGTLDYDYIQDGVSNTKKKLLFAFEDQFNAIKDGSGMVEEAILIGKLNTEGFTTFEIEKWIEQLKKKGDLFEPKPGFLHKI